MKVYCIRQKSTGLFIPRLKTGQRRGGSHLEPSNEREPRVFHSAAAARAFLGTWMQGIFKNSSYTTESGDEPYLDVVKQPHRNKDDMEIVELECFDTKLVPGGVSKALALAHQYGGIDGVHHKTWVIDQMVQALTGSAYDDWVTKQKAGEDGPDTYEWDTGVAP